MTDYRIKLHSRGRVLEIAPDAVCKLLSGGLIGFDSTGFDVKIGSYAMNSGGAVTKRRFAERELKLKFEIGEKGDAGETIRREIISMMDPREDMHLEIELFGVAREITVIPYGEAKFDRESFTDNIIVTLSFIAPTVFFNDREARLIRFREVSSLLTFPMTFISGAGMEVGIYRVCDTATLINDGDGECGIVAKILASGGNVVSPGIKCGDKFIKTSITLTDGDTLEIDTRPKMKNITVNGERTFAFDRDSEFFSLPPDESVLSITADSGAEFIEAEVEFVPVYFGV